MFKNRAEAGRQMARQLEFYKRDNPVVLAIPRGGVEVGYYISDHLNCELTVVITRKLGYLNNPEATFGAIAEDGSLYLNPRTKEKLSKDEIEIVIKKEKREIERRIKVYRKGLPLKPLEGRVVILTDDGIATGSTLFASIELCKKMNPKKIIVAAPVCGKELLRTIIAKVDDVVTLEIPEPYHAVSQVYEEFPALTDKQVLKYINKWQARNELMRSLSLIL
jgi:putative phosphoribosyl transferase